MLKAVLTPRGKPMAILLFNALLALLVSAAAPAQPKLSDRDHYEYTGRQPLTAFCPNTIYCYRILVPIVLERIPVDAERRWRAHQWLAHTATGTVVAVVAAPIGSPFVASMLLQTSYAFSFTAYDPYTPDPTVFLVAALVLYCWVHDRMSAVALMALVGVFAKETVALIMSAPAIAVVVCRARDRRWRWLAPATIAWTVLLSFHWYMDTYAGWGTSRNAAANFSAGSWLAIWWTNNPSLLHKALMVFAPFGFGWLFAAAGYRHASERLRQLTIGAIAPLLALVYVQTPERALGNAFFVVVPLAATFLARVPAPAAWAAAITNGLLTARIGLSSDLLPPTSVLFLPAALSAGWAGSAYLRKSR